jgi:hypothetical protein
MQASNSSTHHNLGPTVVLAFAMVVVAVVLTLGVAPGEAGAKASLGGTLSGSTSQGNPGWVRVSSSGRTIREASTTISVRCSFGPLVLPQKLRSVPITNGGRFKATLKDSSAEEGVTLHLFESFSGKFNAARTSVVVKSRIHLNFQEPDGTAETCDSGTVTLHASR